MALKKSAPRNLTSRSSASRIVFRSIKKLYTLSGVHQKDGLRPTPEDLGLIEKAAIVVEDGKILWVGEERKLKSALKGLSDARVGKYNQKYSQKNSQKSNQKIKYQDVQLNAETVLPGFIDPHTHLIFAGDRRNEFEMRNAGATYQEIASKGGGIRSTVRQTRAATSRQLLDLGQERANRLLRQGVTTVEIKSGYGLTEVDELKILQTARKIKGPRVITTFLGPHAVPEGKTADSYLEEVIRVMLPKARKFADRADMFIESGYFSISQARRYFEAARALGFQITGHADQMTRTGASVELARMKATSVDHCVQISEPDIQELARLSSGTTCVCLPTSDFYLKMKYPPARALIDSGARVALATDFNPGTSPSLDISLVGILARLEMRLSLPEVIAALTFNASRALGLEKDIGALVPGFISDFICLDQPLESLFYDVGYHPVRGVFRGGCDVTPFASQL